MTEKNKAESNEIKQNQVKTVQVVTIPLAIVHNSLESFLNGGQPTKTSVKGNSFLEIETVLIKDVK